MRIKPKFLGFISIIAGSRSDERVVKDVLSVLKKEKVKKEVRYISAHRQLKELEKYIREANSRVDVYICIAGLSAALPGIVASLTDKPVIAVPVNVKLEGLDALLSSLETPSGVPVATVGVDNGKNAAYLALRILRLRRINSNGKENGK
ncbi:AIR carboxylase family protein [bacterium]|nr:AIR carboxylase family protein [bacterium]